MRSMHAASRSRRSGCRPPSLRLVRSPLPSTQLQARKLVKTQPWTSAPQRRPSRSERANSSFSLKQKDVELEDRGRLLFKTKNAIEALQMELGRAREEEKHTRETVQRAYDEQTSKLSQLEAQLQNCEFDLGQKNKQVLEMQRNNSALEGRITQLLGELDRAPCKPGRCRAHSRGAHERGPREGGADVSPCKRLCSRAASTSRRRATRWTAASARSTRRMRSSRSLSKRADAWSTSVRALENDMEKLKQKGCR